ncbi:ATP-binding protein [Bacteroidales bacterium]|nr:ATP-binding protein [Bacteroidales bacterium]
MDTWNLSPIAILYFTAAIISFILSYMSWLLRPARGTTYFSIMLISLGIWQIAYPLELFSVGFDQKILLMKIQFTGMAIAMFNWIIFVSVYTQYDKWVNKKMLIILAIIPFLTISSVLVAPHPNLMHHSYVMEPVGNIIKLDKQMNLFYFVWVSFAYIGIGLGGALIIMRTLSMPKAQRKQIYFIVPMIIILIMPNALHIIKKSPIYPYDPTSLSMAIIAVLFMISIYRHRFLEIMPVAHDQVFQNMWNSVIIIDSRQNMVEINPSAEKLFEVSKKEVLGKNVSEIFPESTNVLKLLSEKDGATTELTLEKIQRTFDLRVDILKDSTGSRIGNIIVLHDITEQKNAINELDAYAGMVAHDLRTPLNSIIGFAQLLQFENNPAYIETIQSSASNMSNIIGGLLKLAKVRKLCKEDAEHLNMEELLGASLTHINQQIESSGAIIHQPKHLLNCFGNISWIEEVWVNLISNAIKYGGSPPKITITSHKEKNIITYTVADNGEGLSAKEQELVFVEFSRLKQHNKKIAGHGIGLSIVKRIIEKSGGKVGVKSKKGVGSEFYFSLPTT